MKIEAEKIYKFRIKDIRRYQGFTYVVCGLSDEGHTCLLNFDVFTEHIINTQADFDDTKYIIAKVKNIYFNIKNFEICLYDDKNLQFIK